MRCHGRPWAVLAAVTKGLLILWAVPGQEGWPLKAPTVQQTQALVKLMAEDAQELFTFYEKDHHLAIHNICRTNEPPQWLQGPVKGPCVLQRLWQPMVHMDQALQDIIRHQRDLSPPGAEILRRLNNTHRNVRGLLNNLAGLFPALSPRPSHRPPPSPAGPTSIFKQKLQGCRILWSYASFMARSSAQLEARGGRRCRERRRSQRGSRIPARP
ncbi:oncostatin-M [Pithys albifrons albifrons]|uniref:oncostatin-M n=1 Tax=Pithys albifrons albifrons TaxID=3385563 RepID=UPI003A5CFBED